MNAEFFAAIADIDQIVRDYDMAKAKLSDIKNMYTQTRTLNENVSMFFEALEDNLPKDIAINTYKSSDAGVEMSGITKDYDAIAKFIIQLKKIECVENAFLVDLNETEQEGTGEGAQAIKYYEFNITANFVSMVEDDTEEEEAGDAVLPETSAE